MSKIKFKLIVTGETEFDDDESDINTVIFLHERNDFNLIYDRSRPLL